MTPVEPTEPPPPRRFQLHRLGVDLRPGEGTLCWVLFAMHFLVLAFQYAAKSVRQASYVDALGADRLPFVYLLIAIVSYPVLLLYGRLVDRFDQRRLIAGSGTLVAASLVAFWWLFGFASKWVSVVFYVWVSIIGILLVSQFWSYSSHLLNPRQAKRLFGFLGAGGLLGSIAGGQMARLMSHATATRDALLLAAGVLLALAVLVQLHGRSQGRGSAREAEAQGGRPAETLRDARDGLDVVRSSRYLQLIAVVMLLSSMVAQVIDLQFSWVVEENTHGLAQRTAVFGNLFSVMGLSAFVFQMVFTARIHRRLGVGFALRVLPVTNGLGSVLFALAAMSMPLLLWPAAWILKIGENGLRYSLDQASRELLFQPVAAHQRPKAKAFIDVFVQRLGKGAAAVALLPVTFHLLSPEHAVWLSLAWIAVWLALVGATHRRYVTSFRDTLLRRGFESDQRIDLSDVRTLEVLIEGMGSSDPREVLHSLELLEVHGRGHLVPPLLLHHADSAVRCKTLRILRKQQREDAAPLVEKLLVDPDSTVRATATLALVSLTPQDIGQLMLERLRDADVRVRGVAVSYLATQGDAEVRQRAESALAEMLSDGDAKVRIEAARALGAIGEPHYQAGLVRLLYDKDPRVIRGAMHAVQRRVERGAAHNPLYVPILISHLHYRRLKHDARNALVAYGEGVIPALKHFLGDDQEEIWVRRALPKTIAEIGGARARVALTESLVAVDPFLRRKVIEALARLRAEDPTLRFESQLIEDQLGIESRAYLRSLTDLWSLGDSVFSLRGPVVSWSPANGAPHLLLRLLADRMDDHLSNVFALLALIYPPRDIRAAHRSLLSEHAYARAHAVEYLDNLLAGEVKRLVFAVIDDVPIGERLRQARRLFELATSDAATALRRLASSPPPIGDVDGAWVSAAALHYIYDRKLAHLYPVIRRAAESHRGPLVEETTELLLSRIDEGSA